MTTKKIAVLPGDGIGVEVMAQALRVLEAAAKRFEFVYEITQALAGGAAYEKFGAHLPDQTLQICRESDAILFGSVGGPVQEMHLDKWRNCEANSILTLRKTFKFNVNLRPVKVIEELSSICPLRKEIIARGVDILFVRELLGDCYFGEHKQFTENGSRQATDLSIYTEEQVASVAHAAFKAARQRRRRLTSVDKANVLDTSKLWRQVVHEIAKDYQDVVLEDMLVDNCAMQIIRDPSQFDVVLTTNMFGDILSDAAAVLPGSLGLLASASLNADGFGLYEPPGGSAQDIAGKGIANPIAQILSVALMLRFSFQKDDAARAIEEAVLATLRSGLRTGDILDPEDRSVRLVNTVEMTDGILANLTRKTALAVG